MIDQHDETSTQDGKTSDPISGNGADGTRPTTTGKRKPRNSKVRRKKLSSPADKGLHGQSTLDPSLYINRELSWLEFNQRVLDEAKDTRHPLLERVKFLAITSSNLDEFFMIRVAAIKEQILAEVIEYSPDGKVPTQQLKEIHKRVSLMQKEKSDLFWNDLHPKLAAANIQLLRMSDTSPDEYKKLADFFAKEIFPVLTPLAFDPGHPFPYISNLSLSLAVVVCSPKGEERFARVKVPDVFPRLVEIPNGEHPSHRFVWLEDLIKENLGMLFPGMTVRESYAFEVTRNADIEIQEDEAEDLIHSIEESIKMRRFGSVVRIKVEDAMPQRIIDILAENLEITQDDVYHIRPPLGLSHMMQLLKLPRPELKDPPFHPSILVGDEDGDDIFNIIKRGDVVLHHPYDSFAPVVQFIKAAATDPNVLAIKQTLYRIGKESPLVPLLIHAEAEPQNVDQMRSLLDAAPDTTVIWAHNCGRANTRTITVMLRSYPKLTCDLAGMAVPFPKPYGWGTFGTIAGREYKPGSHVTRVQNNDGTINPSMRDLFETFPDRFIIGTDTAHPFAYSRYADMVAAFRRLLSQLKPETARKIGYDNAERLYGTAR